MKRCRFGGEQEPRVAKSRSWDGEGVFAPSGGGKLAPPSQPAAQVNPRVPAPSALPRPERRGVHRAAEPPQPRLPARRSNANPVRRCIAIRDVRRLTRLNEDTIIDAYHPTRRARYVFADGAPSVAGHDLKPHLLTAENKKRSYTPHQVPCRSLPHR